VPAPLGVIVATGPLEPEIYIGRRILDELRQRLPRELGVEAVFADLVYDNEAAARAADELARRAGGLLVVAVTGGTDGMVYNAARRFPGPVAVYANTRLNALAAVREAIAALRREGARRPYLVVGPLTPLDEALRRLRSPVRALAALGKLRGSKLGLVGEPEPWILSRPSPDDLRRVFGVELVRVAWDEMLEEAKRAPEGRVSEVVGRLTTLFPVVEVSRQVLEQAVRVYLGLKRVVERYGLAAVAVEAHDMLVEELRDWGPYLAVALLSDEGVPADYEGDVEAVLTKLLVYLLTGKPSFMANITDFEGSRIVLSHCTVPVSMIDPGRSALVPYFETGRSVAIRGVLREGEVVTIARIGGRASSEILVARGRVVRGSLGRSDLCRTQVLVELEGRVELLLEEPLGNHTVMVYGDHVDELLAASRLLGLRPVTP
jgi:L-fucose isomerase-like protein